MRVGATGVGKLQGSAFVVLLLVTLAPVHSQSGRNKQSGKKPTVAPVPIEVPTPSAPEKPKEPALPKMVDGERVYRRREVDTEAIVLKKPPPRSTEESRRHSFRGKIVVQAILTADGEVTHITIIEGLPYGLNEKAIEAARKIKFEPATKDSKPVSQWIRMEYSFWFT